MSISLFGKDLNIIQKLDDEPNDVGGMTSAELKAKFDESGLSIQEYLNNGVSKTTLASQISTNFRKKYVTLKKSGKGYADLQARLLTAYEALGYDRAKKLKGIQKWMEKTE